MSRYYRDQLDSFTLDKLPTLDTAVLGALELLADSQLPQLDTSQFKRPLVVGSGNAEATGRIIFRGTDAVFASESSFKEQLAKVKDVDQVVIVSASGAKHAPVIAEQALAAAKPVTLITTTANSPTEQQFAEAGLTTLVYPKNREPYTYNTSTYMAMMQGAQPENIENIQQHINQLAASLAKPDLSNYQKFYLIVPPGFEGIIRMLQVKFIELFGRQVARDVETSQYVSHATTVVPSDELFISFGSDNNTWGRPEDRWQVPLPDEAGYVAMMAVSYYVVGLIQQSQPPYFADNIAEYCQFISGIFGQDIQPIVSGS